VTAELHSLPLIILSLSSLPHPLPFLPYLPLTLPFLLPPFLSNSPLLFAPYHSLTPTLLYTLSNTHTQVTMVMFRLKTSNQLAKTWSTVLLNFGLFLHLINGLPMMHHTTNQGNENVFLNSNQTMCHNINL
jgi:hypothetical protein